MSFQRFLCLLTISLGLLFEPFGGSAPAIDSDVFQKEIQKTLKKIPEFTYLIEKAKEHNLKVWLFGGTASTFAHYVKESTLYDNGLGEYNDLFFQESEKGQRNFLDIYRPTQDLDIVADGALEDIRAFESDVVNKLPSVRGDRDGWEVRPLRESDGGKMALLGNFDFLNQHTDSHSVGMIALNPDKPEMTVRDLFHWNSKNPPFLQDVLAGKLRYYHSDRHHKTSRFQHGMNPEIIAVIRYFIKLFQHELTMGDGDLENLTKVISEFKPQELESGYVSGWMKHNVPKLFLHSQNVEYAWNTLEEVGLRKKLLKIGDVNQEKSAAWWMNKEPLRSFEVGLGTGKTAKELGIEEIYHRTPDFFVWTVITRSKKGTANVFQSRQDIEGEWASYGQGLYTSTSKKLNVHGKYIITIELNPMAREGSDFTLPTEGIVLIKNKNALEVIPEKFDVGGIAGYLELATHDGNKALLLKAKRDTETTFLTKKESLQKKEIKEITSLAVDEKTNNRMLSFLFSLDLPLKYSREMISQVITKSQNNMNVRPLFYLARSIFPKKRVELKDQINQVTKIAREIRNEQLLVEMLLLSSLPADKAELKKIISQMIESFKQNYKEENLEYLTRDIFSKHAIELKEQISEMIEFSRKNNWLWGLYYLASYTFPENAIELKEQISEMIKASLELTKNRLWPLDILVSYTFRKNVHNPPDWWIMELKEQIFQTLIAFTKLEANEREKGLIILHDQVLIRNKEMKELARIVERFVRKSSSLAEFMAEISAALNGQKNCRSFLSRLPLKRWWGP